MVMGFVTETKILIFKHKYITYKLYVVIALVVDMYPLFKARIQQNVMFIKYVTSVHCTVHMILPVTETQTFT